ncbi:radical SAM protein, partial [Cupriavidus sp. 2MCAB6]
MPNERCRVLMVYPRFNAGSFWNYKATCELAGALHPAAPLGLITVAALLPTAWEIRLVDLNTEELAEENLGWADLVMTGGMLPQQEGTLAIIEQSRMHRKPVVVGGPDATSTPHVYEAADFLVLGEAEEIMAGFVSAWRSGARTGVFKSEMGKTDVTKSPTPRFDLLKFERYLHVGIQFSRGCPFNCEFCDIIELYGR